MQEERNTNEPVPNKKYGTEERKPGDLLTLENMNITEDNLVERYHVDGSNELLEIVGNKERGYAVILGKDRLSDWFKTPDEAEKDLMDKSWYYVIILIGTMIGINEEIKDKKLIENIEKDNHNNKI